MARKSSTQKVNDTVKVNDNFQRKQRGPLFKFVAAGVFFVVVGIIFIMVGHGCNDSQYGEGSLDTLGYLEKNSKFTEYINLEDTINQWPNEYFTLCISERKIEYYKNDSIKAQLFYTDGENSNIKDFADGKKSEIQDVPDLNFDGIIEPEYYAAIFKAKLKSDDRKKLCYLYNALAGHKGGYIVLGLKDGKLLYFTPSDFAKYRINKERLYDLVAQHINNTGNKELGDAIKDIVDTTTIKAISYGYRNDTIWCGDKGISVKTAKKKFQDYSKLKDQHVSGWVISDEDLLVDARDYYTQGEEVYFITPEMYNSLTELKWDDKGKEFAGILLKWLLWPGIFFAFVGFSILFSLLGKCLFQKFIKVWWRKFLDRKNADFNNENTESEEIDCPNDNAIPEGDSAQIGGLYNTISSLKEQLRESQDKNADLQRENEALSDARSDAIEAFKKSSEYKKIIRKEREDAVECFKEGSEQQRIICKAQDDALKKYKDSKEVKEDRDDAKSWRIFVSMKSEGKVLDSLNNIHKYKDSFPIIRSMNQIYNDAKEGSKDKKTLIAKILTSLDEQVGSKTGLQESYQISCEKADYADEVRVRFDNCQRVVEELGERKEYKQIVAQGKDLSIWERVAVMLWAMECTNEILAIFGKDHFAKSILDKASETHKEDIIQIFATRIFKKYISDANQNVGALAVARDKMMKDKISEMQSKYQIRMTESAAYKDFVASLDSVHDKMKGEAEFIRIMKNSLVDEFMKSEQTKDEGLYLSLLVAMGLHMSDYIRYMSGNDMDYCPNYKFALSKMDKSQLEKNAEFRYRDPAYSGEYTNRVYEWLQAAGVKHLSALVGNKLIMP